VNFPLGWELNWPTWVREDEVKTYPSIHFGWHPWETFTTTNDLPAAIGDINDFTVPDQT